MEDKDDFFTDQNADMSPPLEEPATKAPEPTPAPVLPHFGEGPMPAEARRFNVTALLWGTYWALVNGLWPRFLVLLGLAVAETVTLTVLRAVIPGWPRTVMELAPQVAFGLAIVAVNLWFARTATARLWETESQRLAGHGSHFIANPSKGSWPDYVRSQRTWMRVGLVVWVLAAVEPLLLSSRAPASALRVAGDSFIAIALLVVVAIAWVGGRIRRASSAREL